MITYYRTLIDQCCVAATQAANVGESWNQAFLDNLDVVGLRLGSGPTTQLGYPDNTPLTAPRPTPDEPDAWPEDSLILWITTPKRWRK